MTEPLRALDPQLYDYPNWVFWREEKRDGKPTKVPYTPTLSSFDRADTTDPETWESYTTARRLFERRKADFDGMGFVFSDDDPFCGIDVDSIKDKKTGEILEVMVEDGKIVHPMAQDIVGKLNSYTEISPSGTGVHIIVRAAKPGDRNRTQNVEIYDRDRYFTVSGDVLEGYPGEIRDKQRQLNELYATLFPPKPDRQPAAAPTAPATLDEETVLERIRRSRKADEFEVLWQGGYGGHEGASEATLDLVNILCFFAQGDEDLVDSLFRRSGLMRPKWDDGRPDNAAWGGSWGRGQIRKSLADMTKFYSPREAQREPAREPQRQPEHPATPAELTRDSRDSRDSRTVEPQESQEKAKPRMIESPAVPFPVEVMPEPTRQLINEATASLGCAPEFVAVPMLGVISQAIGATRVAQVKRKFTQMSTLFLAVVGSPGAMKTPAASPALVPLKLAQKEMKARYAKDKERYEKELRQYDVDKSLARKEDKPAEAPPTPPVYGRTWAADTTLERLVGILEENPRGIMLYRDELAGWIRGMDQYKGGAKGSDRQNWLSLHDGVEIVVDRKSRENDPLTVDNPFVSLFGGIQPRVLGEMGGGMEDGLMDRFLFAYPATRHIRFSRVEITRKAEIPYENLYDALSKIELHEDEYGAIVPQTVPMNFQALRAYEDEYNRLGAEMIEPGFDPKLEAQWSKARGHLVRLALILAMCRIVTEKIPRDKEEITAEDVQGASTLMRYFLSHAKRVYGVLEEVDPDTLFANELAAFLEEQENDTPDTPGVSWTGPASELRALLQERDCPNLPPTPARLSRYLTDIARLNPRLRIQRQKSGDRAIRLVLETVDTLLSSVPTVLLSNEPPEKEAEPPQTDPNPDSRDSTDSRTVDNLPPAEEVAPQPQPEVQPSPPDPNMEFKVTGMLNGCINHRDDPHPECYLCNPNHPKFNRARNMP